MWKATAYLRTGATKAYVSEGNVEDVIQFLRDWTKSDDVVSFKIERL